MKKFRFIIIIFYFLFDIEPKLLANLPLVLLSPQGNSQIPGLQISNDCERNITHSFAYLLGAELNQSQECTASLTHKKTDSISQYKLISMINHRDASLFLKIFFHYEPKDKPTISIYFLTFNPLTDSSYHSKNKSILIPLNRAHCEKLRKSKFFAKKIQTFLTEYFEKRFTIYSSHGIPLIQLTGICCPAVAIDIGISQTEQQNLFVNPIAKSIIDLIKNEKNT